MDLEAKYQRLNQAEKDFLFWHPLAAIDFNSNATTALQEAKKRFSAASQHNGSGDAFRHCFWSAMNARDQGVDLAKKFGDAHEDWIGNPVAEKTMDLYNNSVGFEIGRISPGASDRHVAVLCAQAWANNRLVQISGKGSSDLTYSNSYEKMLYEPVGS
ncbi:MAG: hypothetical protein HY900_08490 [Deltaproteobacteria bacterium]|nr:hypothetical protein [Deltaproteobacteria bacterium]